MRPSAAPRRLLASIAAVGAVLLFPAVALGHPLGNFTINTHNVVRVSDSTAIVDHVLDMAEIPAFQERQRIDTDGDEAVSAAEAGTYAERTCHETADLLGLQRDGTALPLQLTEVGISFPPGQGGLDTLRLVCVYTAPLDDPIGTETGFFFEDRSHEGRLGWREIVVVGDGVRIGEATVPSESISARLTAYPEERLSSPLSQTSASFRVLPGGTALPPFAASDAGPIGEPAIEGGATPPINTEASGGLIAAMNEVIQARELTPFFVAFSITIATALGALHALSPGHGKTVIAAYLVGARGTARHAIGLGLTVTVSHTLGVLGLAVLTLFASTLLPAERLYPILGLVSGLIILGIGLYLVVDRLKARREAAAHAHPHAGTGEHSHGPLRHSHVPTNDRQLSWRNLFALGLAGGLVPSASALILLLGSVSLGRPAYGVVLIIFFGLGMAAVLVSVGVLMVKARSLLERLPQLGRVGRLTGYLPIAAAGVVLVVGAAISIQAFVQLTAVA